MVENSALEITEQQNTIFPYAALALCYQREVSIKYEWSLSRYIFQLNLCHSNVRLLRNHNRSFQLNFLKTNKKETVSNRLTFTYQGMPGPEECSQNFQNFVQPLNQDENLRVIHFKLRLFCVDFSSTLLSHQNHNPIIFSFTPFRST